MMCLGLLFDCNFCGEQGMCVNVSTNLHYYSIPRNRDVWFNLSILFSLSLLMIFMREGEAIMVQNVILPCVTLSVT